MTDHVESRLSAYLDGSLPEPEAQATQAHLDECPACRAAYEEHTRFEAVLLEATAEVAPREAIWPVVRSRVRPKEPFRFTLRFAGGMALAAAAGFVIALAVPRPESTVASTQTDLWTSFGYGLVDGTPISISVVEEETEG
ncbi:MAG: anti-sigma factor [Candidatus Eisenbacteria bacterium]